MYAVPIGMDRTLRKIGIPDSWIIPMQWWEEVVISQQGEIRERRQLAEPSETTLVLSASTDKADAAGRTELVVLPTLTFETNDVEPDVDEIQEIRLVEVDGPNSKASVIGDKESVKETTALDEHSTPLRPEDGEIKIVCLPSQHNSLFRLWDKRSHWSSWLVEARSDKRTSTCYFGG